MILGKMGRNLLLACTWPTVLSLITGRSTINGILAMQSFRERFSTGYVDLTDMKPSLSPSQSSLIVAILSAGTVLGSLISAPLADFFGRRKSLNAAIGVFCFGVIFQVCSSDIPMLLVGRYVGGCAARVMCACSTWGGQRNAVN
jgi:MFS family permease